MAAEFVITHDREWLVVEIHRIRGGNEKVRRFYLTLDEAAQLVTVLNSQLPVVVQGRSGGSSA